MHFRPSCAALFCLLSIAGPAKATWTIVAVDPATGEAGSAGASCTTGVMAVAGIVPGKGVVVAQAKSNMQAKEMAGRMLIKGENAQKIVSAISDATYDPSAADQQYGVAVLGVNGAAPTAAAFTGQSTVKISGQYVGTAVSVQGNILTGDDVLKATFDAYNIAAAKGLKLADRLMLAMEAGAEKGGDSRCGEKRAQSAYLFVAQPSDPMNKLSLSIFDVTSSEDRQKPIKLLRAAYDEENKIPAAKMPAR